MKIKTTNWMILTVRDGSPVYVKTSSISNFAQDGRFCRVEVGGPAPLHANETDKEIMKYILEGYTFDV